MILRILSLSIFMQIHVFSTEYVPHNRKQNIGWRVPTNMFLVEIPQCIQILCMFPVSSNADINYYPDHIWWAAEFKEYFSFTLEAKIMF